MMEPHINGINHHIAMIDVVIPKLDQQQLAKLEEAFLRIIKSAQLTLADIKRQQHKSP
jgi:hypothetical protein